MNNVLSFVNLGMTIGLVALWVSASRRADAWRHLLFDSVEKAFKAGANTRIAIDCVKAAIDGRQVFVTKAPSGMTLLEAQRYIDETLAPFMPPKGSA